MSRYSHTAKITRIYQIKTSQIFENFNFLKNPQLESFLLNIEIFIYVDMSIAK